MRYTLRQLEYFIAAGQTSSITLASERINISQPSISTAIAHLEREFKVQLFVRHHAQGLSLTPAGRIMLRAAKDLMERAQGLYDFASEATGQVRGDITVGYLVPLAPMVMPELSHSFSQSCPEARLHEVQESQEGLLGALRRAEIDVAVTYDLDIPTGISFTPLASLPAHAVFADGHPLASQSAVSLEELADEALILLDLPVSREYFLDIFTVHGIEPRIGARSPYPEVIRTMVANRYGYTLANVRPRSDLALDGRKVVRVRLSGDHRPMIMGLATLSQLKKPRLVEAFEAHARTFVSDNYIPGMVAPGLERRIKR